MEADVAELRGLAADGVATAQGFIKRSPELREMAEEKLAVVRDSMKAFTEGYREGKTDNALSRGWMIRQLQGHSIAQLRVVVLRLRGYRSERSLPHMF